jgi:hypothetical protein
MAASKSQEKRVAAQKAAKAATTNDALLAEFADFPGIDIIERRLENPDLPGSLPIRLKDEPSESQDPHGKKRRWYLRWINAGIPSRFHTITQGRGYVPVVWDELVSRDDIADRFEGAGTQVRRGDRGQEVLVKMPMPLYLAVKRREREKALERLRSSKSIKDDVAQAAASEYGDEAGSFAYDLVGDVKPGDVPRER